MRSPLMVPLVLVMLMLPLLSGGEDALPSESKPHTLVQVRADNSLKPAHSPSDRRMVETVSSVERTQSRVPVHGEPVVSDDRPHITDDKVLKAVESNLLTLFGLKRRPRSARSIVIPDALKTLYRRQTGMDVETTNFALPGRHTGSANTVRTFTHQGKPNLSQYV